MIKPPIKTHKTSPVKYWCGVPLTENDVIEFAKSAGMKDTGGHTLRLALEHLRNLGHKIVATPEAVAEPSNDKLRHGGENKNV